MPRSKFRRDLGEEFDSKQEANIARIFRLLGIKYERKHGRKIEFEEIAQRHEFRHTENGHIIKWMEPDFYLPETDVFIEVKPRGMDRNDRMRVAAALLKSEDVKLEIITPTIYKMLEKVYRTKIQEWES